jgi:hypothetical protein
VGGDPDMVGAIRGGSYAGITQTGMENKTAKGVNAT